MGTQVILVRVMGHRLFLKVHTKEMTIVQIWCTTLNTASK